MRMKNTCFTVSDLGSFAAASALTSTTAFDRLSNLKTLMMNRDSSGRGSGRVASARDMFGGRMLTLTKCLNCASVASHSELYEDVAVFTGRCHHSSMCHTLLLLSSFSILLHNVQPMGHIRPMVGCYLPTAYSIKHQNMI